MRVHQSVRPVTNGVAIAFSEASGLLLLATKDSAELLLIDLLQLARQPLAQPCQLWLPHLDHSLLLGSPATAIRFDQQPDSNSVRLAVGTASGDVHLFVLRRRLGTNEVQQLPPHAAVCALDGHGAVTAVGFSQDGHVVGVREDGGVWRWSPTADGTAPSVPSALCPAALPGASLCACQVSQETVAMAYSDCTIKVTPPLPLRVQTGSARWCPWMPPQVSRCR